MNFTPLIRKEAYFCITYWNRTTTTEILENKEYYNNVSYMTETLILQKEKEIFMISEQHIEITNTKSISIILNQLTK